MDVDVGYVELKEKCIKIQENNLNDQIKNLENENLKSSFIIGFIGALIAIILDSIKNLEIYYKIFLIILFVLPILLSLYNISSKKLMSHLGINGYFISRTNNFESFLNDIHQRLNQNYDSASKLLDRKVCFTNLSYFFTVLLLLYILFIKLF